MLDDLSFDYDFCAEKFMFGDVEVTYNSVKEEMMEFIKNEADGADSLDIKLVDAIKENAWSIAGSLMQKENTLEKLEEKMKAKYAEKADREKLKKLKIEVKKLEEKLRK